MTVELQGEASAHANRTNLHESAEPTGERELLPWRVVADHGEPAEHGHDADEPGELQPVSHGEVMNARAREAREGTNEHDYGRSGFGGVWHGMGEPLRRRREYVDTGE